MQDYLGEAVIEVTGDNESMRTGLESVIRCKALLSRRLHIVKPGCSLEDDLTETERASLEKEGFDVVVHDVLDPSKMVDKMAAVFIGPDLQVTESGMQKLVDNMKATHHRHSHFAVSSNVRFTEQNDWRNPQNWINCAWYGFLNLILVMDILRSILNLTKYHRTCDLRAQTLSHTYPNKKYLTPRPYGGLSWIVRTGISGVNDGEANVLQFVSAEDGGWRFVLRTIYRHAHMSLLSLRWGLFFWVYYFLFSWPWWVRYLPPVPETHWYYQLATFFLYRDMTSGFWIFWYSLHMAFVGVCSFMYMKAPIHVVTMSGQILLYPLYVTLSPLVFLVGRLRRGNRTWRAIRPKKTVAVPEKEKEEEKEEAQEK